MAKSTTINWINSWKAPNKKLKYELLLRIGKVTVFEFNLCVRCDRETCDSKRFRFVIFNVGFEI